MTGVKRALEAAKNKDFEQAKREQQNARDALNRGAGFSDEVDDLFRGVRVHPSPLVLDLDGNGFDIKLLSAYGPRFDQDGDGRYSRTAWVEATDGLLALDLNGNGMIDSGVELFGNNFLLPSGQRARWL